MPTIADVNGTEDGDEEQQQEREPGTEDLLVSVSQTDELLSPAACTGDLDSGFSGSSSASYRYEVDQSFKKLQELS